MLLWESEAVGCGLGVESREAASVGGRVALTPTLPRGHSWWVGHTGYKPRAGRLVMWFGTISSDFQLEVTVCPQGTLDLSWRHLGLLGPVGGRGCIRWVESGMLAGSAPDGAHTVSAGPPWLRPALSLGCDVVLACLPCCHPRVAVCCVFGLTSWFWYVLSSHLQSLGLSNCASGSVAPGLSVFIHSPSLSPPLPPPGGWGPALVLGPGSQAGEAGDQTDRCCHRAPTLSQGSHGSRASVEPAPRQSGEASWRKWCLRRSLKDPGGAREARERLGRGEGKRSSQVWQQC